VQNVLPGARGTPQERHFPVAPAAAGVGAGMGVEGVYWRVGCIVGAYWVCDWSVGAVLIVGCVFIAGMKVEVLPLPKKALTRDLVR